VPYHDRKINFNNISFRYRDRSESENYDALDPEMQALWEHKTLYQRKDDFTAEEFYDRAGIWAEFGKMCVFR
jgi:hypothetical protein